MTNPETPSSGYVYVGTGRIFYDVRGSGPPILLIHAGIADSRMWEPQLEALAAEHRVVRLDLRGFGQTTTGPEPFFDWEDIDAVCAALTLSDIVVVGASMGARVAVEFALQRTDLVRGLVLVAPGLISPDEPRSESLRSGWDAMGQAFDAGDPDRMREIELAMWVDGPRRDSAEVDPDVRRLVSEMNARVYELEASAEGRQELTPPAVERLAQIRVPVLVVAGSEDQPDILGIADRLVAVIDGAREVVFENTAHMPTMEQPERFNDLVVQFIRELP